ncbi:MAG: hypothetical protein QM757_16370 [Paludibaculum sp.]
MIAAVRKTNQVVQIGMQRRSMGFVRQARKLIQDGAIGRISLVQARWNWHFDLPLDKFRYRANWTGLVSLAPRPRGHWIQCDSGGGAASGITPVET